MHFRKGGKEQRIWRHPILDFKRGEKVRFQFNGEKIEGYRNESIAAALFASEAKIFSRSRRFGRPRGWFCGIGKCSSCLMRVNGIPNVRTCITPIKEEMRVESQDRKGALSDESSVKGEMKEEEKDVQILVIGGGPAGLEAGITARKLGLDTLIVDENLIAGGQLLKQTHKFFGSKEQHAGVRGIEIAKMMLKQLKKYKGQYLTETSIIGHYGKGEKHKFLAIQNREEGYEIIEINADNVVAAPGASENYLPFPKNWLPGVYGAGGVQTLMNLYGVKPGNEALIVGAGNVGLILGYQLLQAGVEVKAVVEAMPHIGGYLVHASKLARLGVPILLRHTIKRAKGDEYVNGAIIVQVDEDGQPIEGTEQELDVDLICIAVGLLPSTKILFQAGCEGMFVNELGGWVPIHNQNMKTTLDGMYLAGDVSGIEEATTAMMEGRIAGADIAEKEGRKSGEARKIKENAFSYLLELRKSLFLRPVMKGKEKVWKKWREKTQEK